MSKTVNFINNTDLQVGGKLAKALTDAEDELIKAFEKNEGNNLKAIEQAKQKKDMAERAYMAFASAKDKSHDLLMQLIQMLGR